MSPWRLTSSLARMVGRLGSRDQPLHRLANKGAGDAERQIQELATKNENLRRRIGALKNQQANYKINRSINNWLHFAHRSERIAEDLRADIYIAHGVQALPAAVAVASSVGGRVYCDVIETPSFTERASSLNWRETVFKFGDHALSGYLRDCDGLLTVGPALGHDLAVYGVPVHVIPNYRWHEPPKRSDALRKRAGLQENDILLLAISNIWWGFEDVVGALARLPRHVHLATLGKFKPPQYGLSLRELARELQVADRVHFFAPVPYQELLSTMAGADVGLIVLDPNVRNGQLALPNRLFDYLGSGLPVCTPRIPDIAAILEGAEAGVVVEDMSPEGWAAALEIAISERRKLAENAERLASELTWEGIEPDLIDALGGPKRVTFFGLKELAYNHRTIRMAQSLTSRGIVVNICSIARSEIPFPHSQANYFPIR